MEAMLKMRRGHRCWMTVAIILILLLTLLSRLTTHSAAAMSLDQALIDATQEASNCVDTGGIPDLAVIGGSLSLVCDYPFGNAVVCTWYYPFYAKVCTTVLTRPPSVPVGGSVAVTEPTPIPTPRPAVGLPGTTGQISRGSVLAIVPPAATPPPTGQSDGSSEPAPASPGLTGPVTIPTAQGAAAVSGVTTASATTDPSSIPGLTPAATPPA